MTDIYNKLGSDVNYVPQIETNDEIEQILSQIKMILGTNPGDVLGSPYFGLNIKRYIFSMSYNQEEINKNVQQMILNNIYYNTQKYDVSVQVNFGKDHESAFDYAVIDIAINQKKCLGIMISQ